MVIPPFVAGILVTLFAELIIFNLIAIIAILSSPNKKKKETNDGTNNEL